MMGHIMNQMRQQAEGVMNGIDQPVVGIVQSYDPNTYSCKVLLQPSGSLTGWLPVLSLWAGNGWGMFAPPVAGVAVAVIPKHGSLEAAFVLPAFFNDEERPLSVPQGEFWLVHKSGASFKFTNDGKLAVNDGHGASVVLNGNGTISSAGAWTHTGDFHATGNVADSVRSMAQDRVIYDSHTHPAPGGTTGIPNQQE